MAALFAMTVLGSLLEIAGIGLVLPVVATLIDPEAVNESQVLVSLREAFGSPSAPTFSLLMLALLGGIYLFKNLYRTVFLYSQTRFAFGQQVAISKRLLRSYLARPYLFHLQRNSAELIRNITTESDMFALVVLLPGILLVAEGFVIATIFGLLFVINFWPTLAVVSIFVVSSLTFYGLVRGRLARWGAARQHHDMQRLKHAQESFGGLKYIKVQGSENFFLDMFLHHASQRSKYAGRAYFFSQLPIVWLEVVAMTTVLALFSVLVMSGASFDKIIPTLALFTAAALRVMPSFNKILYAAQQLRFGNAVVNTVYKELFGESSGGRHLSGESSKRSEPFRKVSISNLSFRYPGAVADALTDVSFDIEYGQSIGVIGTSGSGKTTLIDLIMGLLTPTQGDILSDGQSIYADIGAWQKAIGYVPQNIYLADQTLRENVAFGVSPEDIDDASVERAIKLAQLESLIEELPDGLWTMVGERGTRLSGGQKQRIGIARALYHDPDFLILDEATAALDMETEQAVMDAVRSLSGRKTLIMIAHRLTTVSACTVVHRLEGGRIVWSGKLDSTEEINLSRDSDATGCERDEAQ